MPLTSIRRLTRLGELTGVEPAPELIERLAAADTDAERARIGVSATVDLANAALDAGAPGHPPLHLQRTRGRPGRAGQTRAAPPARGNRHGHRHDAAPRHGASRPPARQLRPDYPPTTTNTQGLPMTEQNTATPPVPGRLDPGLPAHRPPPRTQEGRRGLLGRQDRRRRPGRRRQGNPARHRQAPPGPGPDRSRRRPRHVLLLRPGARRRRPPRRRARPLRRPPQRRRPARHRRLLHPGPRQQGPAAAGNDQVVRHQLPLPRPGNRPGDQLRADLQPHRRGIRRTPSPTG